MSDNEDKSLHGNDGQRNLEEIIKSLQEKKNIISYIKKFRAGYSGYDQEQFYCPYLIEFSNHECWILHSTTSVRSDRMGNPQWNAQNLKKIDNRIKRAYVIFPDALPQNELRFAINENQKIVSKSSVSAVDGVISQSEIHQLIQAYSISLEENQGQALAHRGNDFELTLVEVLNNDENFLKWKNNDSQRTGFLYGYYKQIMDSIGVNSKRVESMEATNKIPPLPNRGRAKTDVLLTIKSQDGMQNYTFSCKRTGKKWVSVHEYSAEAFVEVLNIKETELVQALHSFQKLGGFSNLSEKEVNVLNRMMPIYNEKLSYWVIGGHGGKGDPSVQWANWIITLGEENATLSIHTINEYINLVSDVEGGQFGTCFKWTYPSKKKGQKIQLKMKVV